MREKQRGERIEGKQVRDYPIHKNSINISDASITDNVFTRCYEVDNECLRCSCCFMIFCYHECEDSDTLKEFVILHNNLLIFIYVLMFLVLSSSCSNITLLLLQGTNLSLSIPSVSSLFVMLVCVLVLLRCHPCLSHKRQYIRIENITVLFFHSSQQHQQ